MTAAIIIEPVNRHTSAGIDVHGSMGGRQVAGGASS